MPIFKGYKIDKCKEVMVIPDEPFYSFTSGPYERPASSGDNILSPLTDGSGRTSEQDRIYYDSVIISQDTGTGDFLGVARKITLIGQLVETTMDTGRFTVAQINNTTQADFDQQVALGNIRITERIVGWIEIAKARVSLFYEECLPTDVGQTLGLTNFIHKRATVEHYYDFRDFKFGENLVAGSSPADRDPQHSVYGNESLRPVGSLPQGFGQGNLTIFGPGFDNVIDLQSYMRMFINSSITFGEGRIANRRGEFRSVGGAWLPLDGEILQGIPLYEAKRDIHFDNPTFDTAVEPQITDPMLVSTGRYGTRRDTILEGFRASTYIDADYFRSVGRCQSTRIPNQVSERGGGGVLPGGGSADDGTGNQGGKGPGIKPSVVDDATVTPFDREKIINQGQIVTRKENDMCVKIIHDFPKSLKERMMFSRDIIPIQDLYINEISGDLRSGISPLVYYGFHLSRMMYFFMKILRGEIPYITSEIPDILDTPTIPRGSIRKEINPETGCIELTYIGSPVGDYIGTRLIGPEEFEVDPDVGEPVPYVYVLPENRLPTTGGSPFKVRKTIDWRKRYVQGTDKWEDWNSNTAKNIRGETFKGWFLPGRGEVFRRASTLGGGGPLGFTQLFEIVEEETPVYFTATDQLWEGSVNETKFIYLANLGGTRIIVNDYTPRGNANFINVSLLDTIPVVINPGEVVKFAVDYVRTTEGLQQWKKEADPFPALATSVYPYKDIVIDYDVYAEVPGLGFMPIDEIPETSKGRAKGKWSKSNRNKLFSVLRVDNTAGKVTK